MDEADRLLESSIQPDLEAVVAALPAEGRQTLLFSATLTRQVAALQVPLPTPFP